jgi:adenosylcobinamide-GDP ribazoletransferase
MLKRELEYFFAALRFFTRLPVPAWVGHSAEQLDHATRYFSLMGIIVGSIGASVTLMASLVLPVSIAIILGMVATLLTTGAFHEDGLADAVDGFGGGWTVLRILDIMKDSRVGSYGAVAMSMMLLGKFSALHEIGLHNGVMLLGLSLIAGHAVSRLASTSLLFFLEYVREDALSKSKPLGKQIAIGELLVASIFGLAPTLFLAYLWPDFRSLLSALLLTAAVTLYVGRYFRKHIGGYTGDCLGATQQLAEVSFYIGLLCKFS